MSQWRVGGVGVVKRNVGLGFRVCLPRFERVVVHPHEPAVTIDVDVPFCLLASTTSTLATPTTP